MSTKTNNYNLIKPGEDEFIDIKDINKNMDTIDAKMKDVENKVGAPMIATTAAEMTNKERPYVYVGSQSGYTKGNWYYWNGSSWVSGGVYNSVAVETDKTLTVEGKAADGEVVGQEIGSLKEDLDVTNKETNNRINDLNDYYADHNGIVNDNRATIAKKNNNIVEMTISNTSLFNKDTPIYINEKSYNYDGLKIEMVKLPKNIGVIFGKDRNNNYYFLSISYNSVTQIYKVAENGLYEMITGDAGVSGSNFKKISIDSFDCKTLKISVFNDEKVGTYETDLSSYNITKKCIGFIPYSSENYTVSFKYKDVYKNFEQVPITKLLLTQLVNANGVPYRIKFIGDSITAGVGGSNYNDTANGGGVLITGNKYTNVKGTCWCNSIKKYLESKFENITIDNYGYSGATAEFIYQNKSDFIDGSEDLIVLMLGTNNRNNNGDTNRLYVN